MTHPPTLPNGFSTDFSEAPDHFSDLRNMVAGDAVLKELAEGK